MILAAFASFAFLVVAWFVLPSPGMLAEAAGRAEEPERAEASDPASIAA